MSLFDKDFTRYYDLAKKFLRSRDRSSYEVRSFFISKGIDTDLIEEILNEMIERGVINDSRFLKNFIYLSIYSRRIGRSRIIGELEKLGFLKEEIINSTDEYSNEIFIENCKYLIHKKYFEKQVSEKDIFNCLNNLLQKGYEKELIENTFRQEGIKWENWD